jgi:hypothetical protein
MQDTSSIGVSCRLIASQTYPAGISFTAFPEDTDIGVSGDLEIAGNASGVNGDLITWSTVAGIEAQVPLIPNTEEESLMDILFQANRASKNRAPKKDVITLVITNPVTGVAKTYIKGRIKRGSVGYTYGGDGRIKTKNYGFVFEDAI